MNIRKKFSAIICLVVIIVMVLPFGAFAEDVEDEDFSIMTSEELSAYLLQIGAGFSAIEISGIEAAGVTAKYLNVIPKYDLGKIAVYYYTRASSIANRVGIKDLKLYEGSSLYTWNEIRDTTDFDVFTQEYASGYYYNNPVNGKYYYAEGDHYCVFGTTMYEQHNSSLVVQY
ncbi:MAG: hypothetical protein IJM37_03515 [Lachnospiraceae bacterium]|nr:hypothetical protein [Lachnospiraceae bacterium]